MRNYKLVPFYYIFILISFSFADDIAISMAHNFVKLGNFDAAITEYKRYLFFHKNASDASDYLTELGQYYIANGNLEEALAYLDLAEKSTATDSVRQRRLLDQALILIKLKEPDEARLLLSQVNSDSATIPDIKKLSQFYSGLSYLSEYSWENAHLCFIRNFGSDSLSVRHLEKWFYLNPPSKPFSHSLAQISSAIFPGMGQFYSGEWKQGLYAMSLNGITGYALITSALDHQWPDIILYGWLFTSFYIGNLENAKEQATAATNRINEKYAAQYLHELQSIIYK